MKACRYFLIYCLCLHVPLWAQEGETDEAAAADIASGEEGDLPEPTGNQLFNLDGVPKEHRTKIEPAFWPARPGEAAVCMWKDDKSASISYSIDDNCAPDVEWWLQETAKRGIPMTWFLVTSGVDGRNKGFNGTWELWRKVVAAGHAVESHTATHLSGSRNPETWKGIGWEYGESIKQIEENIPNYKVMCLAYPGGNYPGKNDKKLASKYFLAARGGRSWPGGAQGINYMAINAQSRSVYEGDRRSNLNNVLDNNLAFSAGVFGGWANPFSHKIHAPYTNALAMLDFYTRNQDKLWAGLFRDIARYGQERETSVLTVKENRPDRIALGLSDRMDDRYYDVPLTVKVRLPDAWRTVAATQGGAPVPARTVEREGSRFALVEIVPDKGDTILLPGGS